MADYSIPELLKLIEADTIYIPKSVARRSDVYDVVLKIKPCKRNNHQNSDHTKDAAKEGNAEERPDAGCGIKR